MHSFVSKNWRGFLSVLPLPMLGLAASYGVYRYALIFVPWWVALITASSFELVYIGLSVARLSSVMQRAALYVSLGAVATSILYNVLDGFFHRRPEVLAALPWWGDLLLSIVHGAPLAVLAFLVSRIVVHGQKSNNATQTDKPAVGGRPAEFSVEDMITAFTGETIIKRAEVIERLGCSAATASKLLADAVDVGVVKKNGVGYIVQK